MSVTISVLDELRRELNSLPGSKREEIETVMRMIKIAEGAGDPRA